MFNQRQWDELNAFAASFAPSTPGNSNAQPQSQLHHAQHHHQQDRQFQHQGDAGNQHFFEHQHQQHHPLQPQPPTPAPQQHFHQQQPHQTLQYGFSPQQEWPRFDFDPSSPADVSQPLHHHGSTSDFGAAPSGDMDWTPATDFGNGFPQGLESGLQSENRSVAAGIKAEPGNLNHGSGVQEETGSGGGVGGIGRLIAQFENKDYQPPLPPRPVDNSTVDNSATSPITINHQQPSSHFGHFNTAPQGNSFATNNFASHSFASNRIATPIDSHFGSYGTSHNGVASPIATSPHPASFGGFRDASCVTSPSTNQINDPFGSIGNIMASDQIGHSMTTGPMAKNRNSTTSRLSNLNTTTTIRPTSFNKRSQRSSTNRPSHNTNTHISSMASKALRRGHLVMLPVQPAISAGNQFILELNPGSKAKAKAPVKPPKPKGPKPDLAITTPSLSTPFSPRIKQEPSTPQPNPVPSASDNALQTQNGESSTSRPSIINRPSREQVPAEAWEGFKATIRDLYLEQRKPLKEVMSIMAEKYNFQATPKMYKTRFSQWGFVKNNTEDEVKKLLSMKFQRDAEGKVSEFVRNGKIVNLGTYLKRKGVTEYDLVDFELPANLPSHIRCRTPTPPPAPEYLKSPDLMRAQELVVGNMRKAFLQCRQWELETERQVGWPSTMVWGAPSSEMLTEANFYFEASDVDSGGQCLMNAFNQLEIDLKQLSPQAILEVLLGMVRRDPGLMTALCKYVAAFSTTNYDRSHPLRQIFTCLYEVQQKHGAATLSELLWGSMPLIAEELEAIYGRRHPYVARTWVDLAIFYEQKNTERLEKLALELRAQYRQMEQGQGSELSDRLALRYATAQLFYAADPESDATKQTANDLLKDMKKAKLLCRVRDSRPNTYCYHCGVKNDPWTKRCRRRYDSVVELMEKHTDVKILPYFEEDFHTTQHEPESQGTWSAIMSHGPNRWGFI
ncbi:hypothetical protein ACO1O0_003492 [Amphichorda felina]